MQLLLLFFTKATEGRTDIRLNRLHFCVEMVSAVRSRKVAYGSRNKDKLLHKPLSAGA